MADSSSPSLSSSKTVDVNESPVDHANQTRVILWCTPRSTSSIITKCLSAVPNSQVYFEVYAYCNEARSKLRSTGRELNPMSTTEYDDVTTDEWLNTAEYISGEDCTGRLNFNLFKFPYVKKMLDNPVTNRKLIFVKDYAFAVDGFYDILPDKSSNYKHAFLIRNPIKTFSSWRKVMFEVFQSLHHEPNAESEAEPDFENFHVINDVPVVFNTPGLFVKELYDLWKHVKENFDPNPVVIDSDDLLTDPDTVLEKFCHCTGIPYTENLLKWDGNPDSTNEWITAFSPLNRFEVTRSYFHAALHSTHFLPPSPMPSEDSLTPDVRECVERTMPFYREMYETRI